MFSGIIRAKGTVASQQADGESFILGVRSALFASSGGGASVGDSVSICGVCLTVERLEDGVAYFDLATETRRCTTLGELEEGEELNLETSMRMGEPNHGHFVQGHVDAVSEVVSVEESENTVRLEFQLVDSIRPYIAEKGSVSINGVSLTVGEVVEDRFSTYIIPFTRSETNLGSLKQGDRANIEADCLARYVQAAMRASQ